MMIPALAAMAEISLRSLRAAAIVWARTKIYRKLLDSGAWSINQIRELEGVAPLTGYDQHVARTIPRGAKNPE
jgi:hypothetical protein